MSEAGIKVAVLFARADFRRWQWDLMRLSRVSSTSAWVRLVQQRLCEGSSKLPRNGRVGYFVLKVTCGSPLSVSNRIQQVVKLTSQVTVCPYRSKQ